MAVEDGDVRRGIGSSSCRALFTDRLCLLISVRRLSVSCAVSTCVFQSRRLRATARTGLRANENGEPAHLRSARTARGSRRGCGRFVWASSDASPAPISSMSDSRLATIDKESITPSPADRRWHALTRRRKRRDAVGLLDRSRPCSNPASWLGSLLRIRRWPRLTRLPQAAASRSQVSRAWGRRRIFFCPSIPTCDAARKRLGH